MSKAGHSEIVARAAHVFGSKVEAERWFEEPAVALEQKRPIDLLATQTGIAIVEDYLTQMEYGVYV